VRSTCHILSLKLRARAHGYTYTNGSSISWPWLGLAWSGPPHGTARTYPEALPVSDPVQNLAKIGRGSFQASCLATVARVLAIRPLNLYFRRVLVDNKLIEWQNLVAQIAHVQLVDGSDTFRWNLTNSGSFTVRSFYLHLLDSQPPFRHKMIWKLKIPLKIKIFLWFLQRGILLTKDNLAKKNWTGSQKYCGCNSNETIQHLFLDCPYARLVWRIIFFATGLTPPRSIRHMFNSWLSNQSKKIRRVIWVGIAAVCGRFGDVETI